MCKDVSFFQNNSKFCFPNTVFLPCRIQFIHFYFQKVEKFENVWTFQLIETSFRFVENTIFFLRLRKTHKALQLIVCVFLLVFPPAVSVISEPAISGILDLVITSSSRQQMDSAISKNNSNVRRGLPLEKSSLWSYVVQCENQTNFQLYRYW